ncbi:MAG TPA: hypothetical protein VJB08_03880 [Candidatus Nanoarchaeia archaeon]|nr:hypothetical protein [Candidatus Nanoarchaeia archaeon]
MINPALLHELRSTIRLESASSGIQPIKATPSRSDLCFIDGGNAEILSSAAFSLHLIRTASVLWREKRVSTSISDFFALVRGDTASIYPLQGACSFPSEIPFTSIDALRREAELACALRNKPQTTIIDGSLDAATGIDHGRILELNDPGLIAVSKTSGKIPAAKDLLSCGSACYSSLGNHSYLVKFHPKAKYLFRVDTLHPETLSLILSHCSDPAFLGYPYGLIVADQQARIPNAEASLLQMKIRVLLGKDESSLQFHLNSKNAHTILDTARNL